MKYKVGDKVKAISKSIGAPIHNSRVYHNIDEDDIGWIVEIHAEYYVVGPKAYIGIDNYGDCFLESDLILIEEGL